MAFSHFPLPEWKIKTAGWLLASFPPSEWQKYVNNRLIVALCVDGMCWCCGAGEKIKTINCFISPFPLLEWKKYKQQVECCILRVCHIPPLMAKNKNNRLIVALWVNGGRCWCCGMAQKNQPWHYPLSLFWNGKKCQFGLWVCPLSTFRNDGKIISAAIYRWPRTKYLKVTLCPKVTQLYVYRAIGP